MDYITVGRAVGAYIMAFIFTGTWLYTEVSTAACEQ